MLGTAIRLAQDGGVHLKRKKDVETWTMEDELKIRAFWCVGLRSVLHFYHPILRVLVAMDIGMSCALGRSCATQVEK
jgi:hypothetical protein